MKQYSLGIDVGGTKIASGLVGTDGRLVDPVTTETAATAGGVLDQVADLLDSRQRQAPIDRVGIVVPGSVNPQTGIVSSAPNLHWRDVDLRKEIDARTRVLPASVHIGNDADAAAWAEHRFTTDERTSTILLLTIGTGIGGGIVVDDRLVRGWSGAAGEVGHLPLVLNGRTCECGSRGCWEKYASGSALTVAAAQAGWQPSTAGPDVLAATEAGDARATDVVRGVAAHLVHGIRILTAAIDPGLVILGGGLGCDPRFVDVVLKAAQHHAVTPPRSTIAIRAAALGPYAGVIGAGDLARDRK